MDMGTLFYKDVHRTVWLVDRNSLVGLLSQNAMRQSFYLP